MSFTIQAARKRLPTKYSEGLGISFNSTSIIDMAAGSCRDSTDVLDLINASTKTANAANTGAGGVDVGGGVAADTMYALYAIGDTTNASPVDVTLSANLTTPNPGGTYDVFRLLGFAVTDSSGDFLNFTETRNGMVRRIEYDVDKNETRVLNGGSATSFTAIDLSDFIPPTAQEFTASIILVTDNHNNFLEIRPTGSTRTDTLYKLNFLDNNTARDGRVNMDLLCSTSQSIDYELTQSSDEVTMSVLGYTHSI